MDTSKTPVNFGEPRNFLKNKLSSIRPPRNTGF